jgi:hypothetical protein
LLRSSKLSGEYKLFFCFIGVYAIAIISYPVKKLIVFHRYRAVSYKAKKRAEARF